MGFYETWLKDRKPGKIGLTPQEMVAAKGVVNLLVVESFRGVSLGQLNHASDFYYGTPEEKDYDAVFNLLCEGIEELKKNPVTS